jgi:hypothetical protein
MSPLDKFYAEANRWLKNELDAINPDRGVSVWFMNNTGQELTWSDSGVGHGERSKLTSDTIPPWKCGRRALESSGFQTGCEGWMPWTFSDGTKVERGYDNPYYGSNSYSCSANSTSHAVTREGGDGNCAIV